MFEPKFSKSQEEFFNNAMNGKIKFNVWGRKEDYSSVLAYSKKDVILAEFLYEKLGKFEAIDMRLENGVWVRC